MKKYFIIGLIILFSTGCYFIHTTHTPLSVKKDSQQIIVPIHTVHQAHFTYIRNFIGSVQPIQSVAVVPYLSGYLKEVYIQAGQQVKKGQTLFLLDDRIPLANLNQAKEAASQALALRENAKSYYERTKNTESKAISPTELEQAQTSFEAANANYEKALAAQKQAQTLYDYTKISAPISGWVGNISATIGEYLSPESKTLATITAFSPIRLVFAVPMTKFHTNFSFDKAILQVNLANKQSIEFQNFTVVQDNKANASTDSVSFFIDVPNSERRLMPEAYIEINFLYPETGILVDKNWVTLTANNAQITLLKDNIITKKIVHIAGTIGNKYWIQEGLNDGDQVITVPISPFQIGQSAQGVEK